jgi:3-(3-hydroxy-phenyl)propionate hydroxylase
MYCSRGPAQIWVITGFSSATTPGRGVGARRRWEFMLMPGDDAVALAQPESIWCLLSRWVTPDDAQLERPAVYTFHSALARSWRRGRLLIAGDAAHQTPPFLGQGMCAGIRDAANLAWKLAAVIRGKAEEALLDTYESERAPHVRQFIDAAVRLGKAIQTTDPELAAQPDESLINDRNFFPSPTRDWARARTAALPSPARSASSLF